MNTKNSLLRVAVLQNSAELTGVDERFTWLAKKARDLQNEKIDLILCPECFMTGYNVGQDIVRNAQPADGDFACRVKGLAKETETAIVYGYPERDGEEIYNSAICIGADGVMLANHRKSVLPPGFEAEYFRTSTQLTMFKVKSVTMAILICYESEFPEAVRNVSRMGAEVVLIPTAMVKKWKQVPQKVIPTRAFENGVYVVYANHSGMENGAEYAGESCIVDPVGLDLARAGEGEEVIVADIESGKVKIAQARLPYLTDSEKIPKS